MRVHIYIYIYVFTYTQTHTHTHTHAGLPAVPKQIDVGGELRGDEAEGLSGAIETVYIID